MMNNGLKVEKKNVRQRKLSESRCVNLARIRIPLMKKQPLNNDFSSVKKHAVSQNIGQDDAQVNNVPGLKNAQKAVIFANSPVGYTLSNPLDVNLNGTLPDGGSQRLTPISARVSDSLDVTIYWADGRGFKFSLFGGRLATASSLMLLLSDHLGIDAKIFKQVCALWMVSDLLEVQLKPHHNPYEIRKNWIQFLRRFTNAEDNEAVADEPLLVLKRNVHLSVERERQIEKEYANEILTEILYTSAKQEVLNGRYICDIELSVKLAVLQMAIEIDPSEDVDIDEIAMFFPSKYQHNIKTFHLFGIPIIGCKGLEMQILDEYRSTKEKFESKHVYRKAYLNIVRNMPFYGAAFFRGYVERPSGGSFREIKKMILSVTLPDISVLVGISYGYLTLIDETKQELLLVQRLNECDGRYYNNVSEVTTSSTAANYQYFLLIFPDSSFVTDRGLNVETETLENPHRIKLLQVFSKQAIMMEALLNSLSKLLELDVDGASQHAESSGEQELEMMAQNGMPHPEGTTSGESSPDREVANGTNNMLNGHNILHYHSDGLPAVDNRYRSSSGSSGRDARLRENGYSNPITWNNDGSRSPFISNYDKLCLATLDRDGHCLEAQGSLRILQEVM